MQLPFMRSDPLGLPLCMRSVDYSLLPVGAMAGRTLPGGRTYTQAAGSNQTEETVRTGTSTVARWTFVANTPRIGLLADGGIGLVLEPPRTNILKRSDAFDNAQWIKNPVVTINANATASPTGTVDAETATGSDGNGYVSNQSNVTAAVQTYFGSAWLKADTNRNLGIWVVDASDGTPGITRDYAIGTAWNRYGHSCDFDATTPQVGIFVGVNTRFAVGGTYGLWGAQAEKGKYATNWIPTEASSADRAGFRLELPVNTYVVGGAFRAQISHVPWADCTAYSGDSATVRLWTIDANTYAEINTTTRVLTVCVNGVSRVAAVPVWWLSGHRIEWYWRVGNGALFVRYRLSTDKGVSYTLPFDPFAGVQYTDAAISTSATSLDLWSDGGSSKWFGTGACKEDFLYTAPAWALQWLPTDDASVKAWFRADGHYTLAGSLVSAWTSQTATAISASQGVTASQPTFGATSMNGKQGLTFDGTSDYLTVTGLSSGVTDLLGVSAFTPTATGASQTMFDSQTGRVVLATQDGVDASTVGYYDGAWRQTGAKASGAQILSWDLRSGSGKVFRNGVQIGSTGAFTQRALGGTITIGAQYTAAAYLSAVTDGIIISTTPSDNLRRQIEAFLSLKTGIAVS